MSDRPPPGERRAVPARIVIAGIIIVLILWFAFANSGRVKIDYLVTSRDSRLIYVILGSAILGGVADRLLIVRRRRRGE